MKYKRKRGCGYDANARDEIERCKLPNLYNNEFQPNYTVRQMHRKMVKSDLISGLKSGDHIRPGPDMAGYENLAGFRPGPGPDMISGETLKDVDFMP